MLGPDLWVEAWLEMHPFHSWISMSILLAVTLWAYVGSLEIWLMKHGWPILVAYYYSILVPGDVCRGVWKFESVEPTTSIWLVMHG